MHRLHGDAGADPAAERHAGAPLAHGGMAPPPRLRVSLLQHAGPPAEACVAVGDRIRRGQCLGAAHDGRAVAVHSPVAGTVEALVVEDLPQWPGQRATHVVIAPAPAGDPLRLPAMDWTREAPEALRARIADAGIAGLGGAGFPTAEKLAAGRALLVLNGAECEPWIACDDALLREQAGEVVRGALLMARIAGAGEVVLAVEDSMVEARDACAGAISALGARDVRLATVPTRYPQGGERQLGVETG